MGELTWIRPGDPPDHFPDPAMALDEPEGLLAAGGDLSPARLLAAYRRGIFPWYQDGQPILWWSPDPRAVLWPRSFHSSRSLRRDLRRSRWELSVDSDFAGVIDACALTRPETWLTAEMRVAYCQLHELGFAHSLEVLAGGRLVGGLYGVALGGAFFAESMFSLASNASKIALFALCREIAPQRGISLIDCQMPSAHLDSLGVRGIARSEFLRLLAAAVRHRQPPARWTAAPVAVQELATRADDWRPAGKRQPS